MPTPSTIPFDEEPSPPGAGFIEAVGKIEPPAGLFSQENVRAPYGQYDLLISYEGRTGVLGIPVAGPAAAPGGIRTPMDIVQVSAPWTRKIVSWTARRDCDWPLIPHPVSSDPNLVLDTWSFTPRPPHVLPDGSNRRYQVDGVYAYYMLVPLLPGDAVPTAAPPYATPTLDVNLLPSGQFVQGII